MLSTGLEDKIAKVIKLEVVAKEIGCTMGQLAIAWCASNNHVSTVILGATTISQLDENLKAMEFIDKITPAIKKKIDDIVQYEPRTTLPTAEDFVYKMRDSPTE